MTPEETKEHIRRRLSELGWNVHIGTAGYEKIFRVTGGAETETNRICHELISLGEAGERREITDAVVDTAVMDVSRKREQPRPRPARAEGPPDADRISIERLAAVLEAKLKTQAAKAPPCSKEPPRAAGESAGGERRELSGLPKALVVQAASEARAKTPGALARDFQVVEACDGERAWRTLLEQPDIEVVVIDLALPEGKGYDLIRRIRGAAGRPRLAALPVVVIGSAQEASAKSGALRAGATDFVSRNADAGELRGRVLAHREAGRAAGGEAAGAVERPSARRPADVLVADRREPAPSPRGTARGGRKRVSATTIITLSATALLVLAIAGTFYVSRHSEALRLRAPETAVTPAADAPPAVVDPDRVDKGAPASESQVPADAGEESTRSPAGEAPPEEPSASRPAPRAPLAQQKAAAASGSDPQPEAAGDEETPDRSGLSEARATSRAEDAPRIAAPQEFSPPGPDRAIENDARAEEAAPAVPRREDGVARSDAPEGEPAPAPREPPVRESVAGADETAPASGEDGASNGRTAARAEAAPRIAEPQESAAPGRDGSIENDAREEEAAPAVARVEDGVARSDAPGSEPAPAGDERAAPRTERPAERSARTASPDGQPDREAAPRTEVAAAAPSSPAPAPSSSRISEAELVSLVQRFASVYEAGDLEQFMGLFAQDARTNDRNGRGGIRKDYEALFRSTDVRKLRLGELSWEVDGDQAYGRGAFNVTVRRQEDSESFLYTGSLTLVVEKIDGRLQIVRLFHGQERTRS